MCLMWTMVFADSVMLMTDTHTSYTHTHTHNTSIDSSVQTNDSHLDLMVFLLSERVINYYELLSPHEFQWEKKKLLLLFIVRILSYRLALFQGILVGQIGPARPFKHNETDLRHFSLFFFRIQIAWIIIINRNRSKSNLKCFAVDNTMTFLVEFPFRNPHFLECIERC